MSSKDESPESIWPADLPREMLAKLYERLRAPGASEAELLNSIRPQVEYEPGVELGHGGMGVVREAWDENLRRVVALKLVRRLDPLRPELGGPPAGERASLLGRFLREARITGQLSHPGIIPVHALGRLADGTAYFTMPVVRGNDLGEVFGWSRAGTQGWSVPRALGILLRVCETLAYAHQRGVIHRDLKPDNVMVGAFGETYVLDWGLAKVLGEPSRSVEGGGPDDAPSLAEQEPEVDPGDDADFTHEGAALGSASFMAPEQAAGRLAEIGPPADVYAAGAMLYTLLVGRRPYQNESGSRTRAQVVVAVLAGPPRSLAELAPRQPVELVAIAQKAMAREPARRYASMAAMAHDLRAFLENRVVQAHRTGAWTELSKWVQRNKGVAAVASLLAVTIVGALAWNAEIQAAGRRALLLSADISLLPFLESRAEALWPARPDVLPALDDWIAQVEELLARRPQHQAQLVALSKRSLGETDGVPQFEDARDRVSYEKQLALVRGLERLASEKGRLREVRTRRAFAASVVERSLEGAEAAHLWAEALDSIADRAASPAYDGLSIAPQLGLVPIGRDPASGLWEFAHLQTGEPARRGVGGELLLTPETGLVLVLIPGGQFLMGAQSEDPAGTNFVPSAGAYCGPVHEVALDPFFLSKYEMTQAQWLRTRERNPAFYEPVDDSLEASRGLVNPVENVSWSYATETMRRLGLSLPTEAQWEYAARAGTSTPWWTGEAPASLADSENVADASARAGGFDWGAVEDWDDGHYVHAPVGAFRANPLGLYDVLGNVSEWCLDRWGSFELPTRPGDGYRQTEGVYACVLRGGCFDSTARDAGVAERFSLTPDISNYCTGVRPARAVE